MRNSLLLLLLATGCAGGDQPSITGREWTVVAIDTVLAPVGAGGRPITVRFDDSTGRIYGFAGCNQYNANYTLTGDSLALGPAVSTRMACEGYDALEQHFLANLAAATHVKWDGQVLILSGNGKAIRAHIPIR